MALRKQGSDVEHVFYVAPNGNDAWSGKLPSPNRAKTDGPLATLQRARDVLRERKRQQSGVLDQPVTVFVRGGMYFLTEPLVFTAEDSGTAECPITFAAYRRETPVVSGGRPIIGWKPVTVHGKSLWAAELPDVRAGAWYFRQLWVDGQRRVRARHPNKGYLRVAEVPDATPETQWNEGQTRFRFEEGDLKSWEAVGDAEAVAMCRWVESHLPIERIDEGQRTVSFRKRSVFRLEPGDPYYVEHLFEALDAPGEWVLDRKSGTLYYMPMQGEAIDQVEAIAPVLEQVVRLKGRPEVRQFVEYLTFRGLTFAHTEWVFPEGFQAGWPKPDVGGFSQAAVGVPGAIYGEGVRHCAFERCTIAHIGNYALELSRGCSHNRIAGSELFDLGAGGVKIGETTIREDEVEQTHDNEISDCTIHDGGRIFHSAIGIWIGQAYDNRLAHNHIHDFYYTGISIGWTWGYGPTLAKGNIVEFNHVHHIGVRSDGDGPILSDMGGIYTLGMQPGMVVHSNVFHDIAGLRYGGWGIYFDEGSTHIVAENNIAYRTTHGGFHQHYGRENIVRNNVFAFGRDAQIQRTRQEPHVSFTFERNIVYWWEGDLLARNWDDANVVLDRNLYWKADGGEIRFADLSWDEWRAKGMDTHSIIADPLFVDPENGVFTLRPGSPASKIGFRNISIRKVGPRKSKT